MTISDAPHVQRVWLTVDEANQRTGVARTTIYAALQCGDLVGSQRGKRSRWRIHQDDLDAWMRAGQQRSGAA